MKCRKIIPYLNAYVDGEIPERRRRTVEAHLAACESCRERVEEIRETDELFQGTLAVPPVPNGLAPRIMAEARRRHPLAIPGNSATLPAWNPLRWIAGLSAPMRLAACATVLLALAAGLALDGTNLNRGNPPIVTEKDLYGLEWFAPTPPGSIGSIYLTMAEREPEKGSER